MSGLRRLLSFLRIILTTEKVRSASADPVIETKILVMIKFRSYAKVVMNQAQGDPEKNCSFKGNDYENMHFSFYVVKAI